MSRRRMLESVFDQVWNWARQRSCIVPPLVLFVGCPMIARRRAEGDPRAFFHVGHIEGYVCTVPESAELPRTYLVGLMLHELGHPMAMIAWGRSEQEDADKAVRDFLGVRLSYRGPLLLEWVPSTVVNKILKE